jgi:hypothetical protein
MKIELHTPAALPSKKVPVVATEQFKEWTSFSSGRCKTFCQISWQKSCTHYKLPEDGQELRPKHVGAVINE